ncbi:hypothetical protein MZM54_03890 [[Brevibacterium] frigoritolerans]|nr:hypothetical protein [Peribacillus frigoritolerans]
MKLYELVELWKTGCLREDLGDEWEYDDFGEGFNIQYKDWLGGIQVLIVPDTWNNSEGNLIVKRIMNHNMRDIYDEPKDKRHDIKLEDLHFGVDARLKYLFGY